MDRPMSEELENPHVDQRSEGRSGDRFTGPRFQASARAWVWLVAAGIVAFVAVVGFAGANSYRDLAAARARVDELSLQISEARQRVSSLSDEIWLLQKHPATLQRVAREELGVVAPGEIVVVLPESP